METRRRLLSSSSKIGTNKAGDVAYVTSSGTIKTCDYLEFSTSMGTPIGVVVVPAGFLPDGKTRIIGSHCALPTYWASRFGGSSNTNRSTLTNAMLGNPSMGSVGYTVYNSVLPSSSSNIIPVVGNSNTTITNTTYQVASDIWGMVNGELKGSVLSSTDPTCGYYSDDYPFVESPYKGDYPNPIFFTGIFADTNGLQVTIDWYNNDFTTYANDKTAYGAAWHYKVTAIPDLQWYLPTAAELVFLNAREYPITYGLQQIVSLGAWSATDNIHTLTNLYNPFISCTYIPNLECLWGVKITTPIGGFIKDVSSCFIRPFAIID